MLWKLFFLLVTSLPDRQVYTSQGFMYCTTFSVLHGDSKSLRDGEWQQLLQVIQRLKATQPIVPWSNLSSNFFGPWCVLEIVWPKFFALKLLHWFPMECSENMFYPARAALLENMVGFMRVLGKMLSLLHFNLPTDWWNFCWRLETPRLLKFSVRVSASTRTWTLRPFATAPALRPSLSPRYPGSRILVVMVVPLATCQLASHESNCQASEMHRDTSRL